MKNAMFFSDIHGTLTGDTSNNLQMKLFICNLERIKKANSIDNFYLSLISSDHMPDIRDFFDTHIKANLDSSSIILGPLVSSKHIFLDNEKNRLDSGKAYQMYKVLTDKHFQNENCLNKVFFADDSFFNHKVAKILFDKKFPNVDFQSFILNTKSNRNELFSEYISDKNGIFALNSLLNSYISNKSNLDSFYVENSSPYEGR